MPENRKILEIVADCPRVQFCYDRYDPFVCHMRPDLPLTTGICDGDSNIIYFCRGWEQEDAAVIIHEFIHYCMLLVYNNNAEPYSSHDLNRKAYFCNLFYFCREIFNSNPTAYEELGLLFKLEDYENEQSEIILKTKLSELIVVPGDLTVSLKNDQKALKLYRERFQALFEFYENVVFRDILAYAAHRKNLVITGCTFRPYDLS